MNGRSITKRPTDSYIAVTVYTGGISIFGCKANDVLVRNISLFLSRGGKRKWYYVTKGWGKYALNPKNLRTAIQISKSIFDGHITSTKYNNGYRVLFFDMTENNKDVLKRLGVVLV